MKYVTLGKTGLRVSRIGFGGIPIQRATAETAVKLVDALLDAGVNYIDTARGYTVSEAFLGAALEGRRARFVLATKSMARTCAAMAADIETSRTELRTDYIDLYQIHNATVQDLDTICAEDGALKALLAARDAGKIGHIGVTVHTKEAFEKALTFDWVETLMFPYNIVETQGEAAIAACKARNIGFICMKPLAGGAIDDAKLALKFVLQNDAVSVAIPGMYTTDEIAENVSVLDDLRPYTEAELAGLARIRGMLNHAFCRRCGYCAPCTVGINIPVLFTFDGYLSRYGLEDWARGRYAAMPHKAGDCIECGVCETRCPYQLPIRQMLKQVRKDFSE